MIELRITLIQLQSIYIKLYLSKLLYQNKECNY